ncbi:hypothetical protein [Dongia sp.]|uniref:hypothetical protein n=1 Tax=Dongia sp. TaxID=1977262 RepID=UPI0035B466DC
MATFPTQIAALGREVKRSLFGGAKARKKAAKKHHSSETLISQSLQSVLARIAEDGIRHLLVVGDAAFLSLVKAGAPDLTVTWASCNIADVLAGAANPDGIDLATFDAALAGGPDVIAGYRLVLARMAEGHPTKPVYWVAENWEFCAGTLPVPSVADDAEALLFNHFQHFFGIKDALQFRIEILCGAEKKRLYRILRADESLALRLSDFFPQGRQASSIAAYVTHPVLTRGRHYRLRVCADVFWRQSLTTLHGVHEFNRAPDHKFEFRLSAEACRDGDVVLTVPNYDRDLGKDDRLVTYLDDEIREIHRRRDLPIEEDCVTAADLAGRRYVGWEYAGYGGSNWYSLKPGKGPGGDGAIAANHHASVPVRDQRDMAMEAAEREKIAALRVAGYLTDPHCIPVLGPQNPLCFGFDCDSANPNYRDFIIHSFDRQGRLLREDRYQKARKGAIFTDDLPWIAGNGEIGLVVVTPDFERIGYRRKGFKTQFDLVVKHRQSEDWDVTEAQNSWRNIGLFVPGVAHFAGPMGSVIGRTNLFARARVGTGYRTAVLACHGSGRLDYKANGALTLSVLNRKGERRAGTVVVPSFAGSLIWLDDLIPDLAGFLGAENVGPLLATAPNADINCQIVTVSDAGAVSLQHMWGY